jgi:hypothetical protein
VDDVRAQFHAFIADEHRRTRNELAPAADCLGVSVENMSRALSDLKQRGAIRLSGTQMVSPTLPIGHGLCSKWPARPTLTLDGETLRKPPGKSNKRGKLDTNTAE